MRYASLVFLTSKNNKIFYPPPRIILYTYKIIRGTKTYTLPPILNRSLLKLPCFAQKYTMFLS